MARLMRSDEHKTFGDISLLLSERKDALKCFCVCSNEYFRGYSEKELKKHLAYHLQEAEYDACLALLAAIEAAFRLDFDYRHRAKRKDSRSSEIRRMSKLPRNDFSHDIAMSDLFDLLAVDGSASGRTINLLKVFFQYRHWLAHGRYWRLKIGGKKPNFSDIYQIAQAIGEVLITN